ncbi:hypothetical protein ACS0TY_034666 [Phlomoides rotata]
MRMNQRETESGGKKEDSEFPRMSSREWCSSFKNPRIVRVSRTFGGKDRHSKVCTVKGLRDRRIRLSVPTAIQLYDLQDKLGLPQPSKVVDWLIDASKHEIDKLPPLPIIPSHLIPNSHHRPPPPPSDGMKMDESNIKWNQDEGFGGFVAQNLFPLPNMPYNTSNPNFFQWDPSNLSLSQFGAQDQHLYLPPSITPAAASYIPQPADDYYFRHINNQLHQNSIFPTTLHFITRSHENDTPRKGINKD